MIHRDVCDAVLGKVVPTTVPFGGYTFLVSLLILRGMFNGPVEAPLVEMVTNV